VTRSFAPHDALRVRRQQATGMWLDLEAAVLLDQSPLRQSLAGCWPGVGRPRTVHTVILDGPNGSGAQAGFLQARRRVAPEAADLTFIAPALAAASGAALSWQRLIPDTCRWLGSRGVERVYVTLSEDDRVALQLFQQAGFTVVTTDLVLRGTRRPSPGGPVARVPGGPHHQADIQRLARLAMPEDVRAQEGSTGHDWDGYPLGGHAPWGAEEGVDLDRHGAVAGAWRLVRGRRGHWLRLVADHQADLARLIDDALGQVPERPGAPWVYAAARGYEPQLNLALRENGFLPIGGRFRLVKHSTVRVLEPAWGRQAARERALETAQGQPTFSEPLATAVPTHPSPGDPRDGRIHP
jgi:hypothetical protein